MTKTVTADTIDKLLPQTQCEECGYPGCRPYAEAIIHKNASLDLCAPGGVKTLIALGEVLQQDVSNLIERVEKNTRPPAVAKIREAECIGCTKCIQACPVDAIIGSGKLMHTILDTECTGCELCIEPCPVDCIDLIEIEPSSDSISQAKADLARDRFNAHNRRLAKKQTRTKEPPNKTKNQDYIAKAMARRKAQLAKNKADKS